MPVESVSPTIDVVIPTNSINLTQKDSGPTRKVCIYTLQDGSMAKCIPASTAAIKGGHLYRFDGP